MSGTSQAAAVVSGAVALLLQAEPGLTPDEVKCKLMSSARPAVSPTGGLAYSIFQQGAGLVNAYDARYETERGCANRGLNIEKDLSGTEHYGGPARQTADGRYTIEGSEGYAWDQQYASGQGYGWKQNALQSQSDVWSNGYAWNQSAYDWQEGEPWAEGTQPGAASSMSINAWVQHE
jgi:serine protease AprX